MSLLTEVGLFLIGLYLAHGLIDWITRKRHALATFTRLSVPGPKPSFWTGNSPEYLRGFHVTLDRWCKKYGPHFGYFFGDGPVLVLSDVDDVLEVTNKLGKLFPNRQKPIVPVQPFNSSLLELRGDKWKNSRRVLTPPFTVHKLSQKNMKDIINNAVAQMLAELEKCRLASNRIDLARYMKSVTLDIISRSAFSMDETDVWEEKSHLRSITAAIMEDTSNVVMVWATYLPFLKRLIYLAYEYSGKYTLRIIQHLNKCIEDYYAKRDDSKESKENILDFMLEQKEAGNLNELEVMGNAITILLAGYDTTSTGLTFALYLLAKHQDIQEKLRAQVNEHHFGDNYLHFDENRCELMDRVWIESLRLYPPVVTFMTRQLDDSIEEIVLSKSGVKITSDMTVQVPVWTIHHDPKSWPNPSQFDPYRENLPIPGAVKQNAPFFTFGSGPRNCIGSHLALMEARAVLTGLLSKYKIELADPEGPESIDPETGLLKLQVYTNIIIHPVQDVFLKLTPISDL